STTHQSTGVVPRLSTSARREVKAQANARRVGGFIKCLTQYDSIMVYGTIPKKSGIANEKGIQVARFRALEYEKTRKRGRGCKRAYVNAAPIESGPRFSGLVAPSACEEVRHCRRDYSRF